MPEMFSGDWIIECLWSGLWSKRFIIERSLSSDGVYLLGVDPLRDWGPLEEARVLTTPPISVSGPSWFIRFEWDGGGVWQPDTSLERSSVTYTLEDGLVVDLLSDNRSVVSPGPFSLYDSAALRCRNLDPQLNPWHPFANPYNFIRPADVRPGGRKPRDPIRPPRQSD
jgi:hypothetical protein